MVFDDGSGVRCNGSEHNSIVDRVSEGDTKSDDWTALMHASNGGHAAVVRLLLEMGADVNAADVEGLGFVAADVICVPL